MGHDPDESIARALTWALLGAPDWTADTLYASLAQAVGSKHRWIRPLVRDVLAAYHRPPQDRPDELTGYLLASTPLPATLARARRQRRPVRIRVITTVEAGPARGGGRCRNSSTCPQSPGCWRPPPSS